MLERDSYVPLYVQLADDLKRRIDRGEFSENGRLPTEKELADNYNISRITVRQAVACLVESEILVRRPGKGTFVAGPKIGQSLEHLSSLGEVFLQQGIKPEVNLLQVEMEHYPSERVRANLGLSMTDSVVFIKRQHMAEGNPVVCACVYIANRFRKYLDGGDLRRYSVYDLLEQTGVVKIAVAKQEISAIGADKALAKILDVRLGSPLLLMENVTYTDQDVPIDNTFFFCRPDMFKFVTTVRRTRTLAALSAIHSDNRIQEW